MSKTISSKTFIASILFSALAVSGSLIFMGIQLANNGGALSDEKLQTSINKGIENYISEQQKAYADQQEAELSPQPVDGDFTDSDAFLGDAKAPVTMVEFSDYQCPYCQAFHDSTFPAIKSKYIDTGKVKFIYRDYPIASHQFAYPAALFAECVGDQKGNEAYYKVHNELFDIIGNGAGFDFEIMSKFAANLGVDQAILKDCFDSDKFKDEIDEDRKAATAAGITGTPGFVINGMRISGARELSLFEQVIDDALAKSAK